MVAASQGVVPKSVAQGVIKSWLAVIAVLFTVSVQAHENRPLYVDVVETTENAYQLRLKIPPTVSSTNRPVVKFPQDCIKSLANSYSCQRPLAGRSLEIEYPEYNPSVSAFLRLNLLSGASHSALLPATESHWQIPEKETAGGVARHYTWLGVEHILIGLDHLLFVACLMFIAGTFRRIVITATGFTLAHSVTLVLAALDVVRVPIAPVETLIAFSILFLAVEIARGNQNTLTYRHPVLVSTSFGFLHGFGFASVLQDIGLPQTELVTGLLFFNIGVELGQILFIAVCAMLVKLAAHLVSTSRLQQFERWSIYAIGTLSSFWLFDRGAGVF